MKKYKKVKLIDIIEFQRGKDLTKENMKNGKYPVVGSNGIIGYHNKFTTEKPSITIGRSGNVGRPFIYDGKSWSHNTTLYIKKFKSINPYYIYYLLKNLHLEEYGGGSTVPTLNRNDIHQQKVYIPDDLKYQNEVSNFFISIDKKINLNNKINDNLEQQAKLLYDYWFTQFDFPDENGKPYRTSGGKMVWNEQLKRDIPEGWEVKSLTEILQKNTDVFDYQSIQPAVDLSIMPSNSIAISQLNSSNSFTTNLFTMKKGDILFGSIRPYLHKAGFAPCDGVVAGTVHSFRVKNSQDNNFALMTVSRDKFFNYAVNVSSGTKMPVVSSDSILDYKVPYNNKIARKYNKIPLIAIISSHIQENQKLISLRDWLLPMLMNGQATIED
ncbi:restriction endonuclease subunit S [Fusobacterium polymorphum]|uniref:restriction endonuclease subunit S n=2 Tax=Fusobacterium nucleatum subsp. polymorphum TaxID=76857 RepID=UPI002B4BC389|nr:restriction endonuclease subunit S [Fusobacterium polymorphum]WRL71487.1 restriction endonuclease subunit S [Fusobacterium polymorphum]